MQPRLFPRSLVYLFASFGVAVCAVQRVAAAEPTGSPFALIWADPQRTDVVRSADGLTRSASTASDTGSDFSAWHSAGELWAEARAKVASAPAWKAWVEQQQQRLDVWIQAHAERPDLVGGWIQEYIDSNGARLTWSPQSPEPPLGVADNTAQRLHGAWAAYVREYNIGRTLDAARLYRLRGQEANAEWAARQLDFYATNYANWPLREINGRARMFAHGLDEATNVFALLDAARLLANYAGEQRAAGWRDKLFYPIAQNLKTVTSPLTNIGLWQGVAIAAIALRYRDAALLAYARDNPQGIAATLRQGVTRDNLWFEGTFSYNAYVLDALDRLLVTATIEGQGSAFAGEAAIARGLLLAPMDYRFEDGSLPTPGDATAGLQAQQDWLYFKLYRSIPTAYGLARAANVRSWETLLDPPPANPPQQTPPPPVASRLFPANRMAVLKSGAWQVFVHYGQVTKAHAQAEAMNYELADGATHLSSDVGTVSYAAALHDGYFTQAAAQNVPLVDGEGQSNIPGSAEVIEFAPAENRLVTRYRAYRPGVTVERAWRVTQRGFAERTSLQVDGVPWLPRRLGFTFHTACRVLPASSSASLEQEGLPRSGAARYWTALSEYRTGTQWTAVFECAGGKRYMFSVEGPPDQRVVVASAPSTPIPERRTVIYIDAMGTHADYKLAIVRLEPSAVR